MRGGQKGRGEREEELEKRGRKSGKRRVGRSGERIGARREGGIWSGGCRVYSDSVHSLRASGKWLVVGCCWVPAPFGKLRAGPFDSLRTGLRPG